MDQQAHSTSPHPPAAQPRPPRRFSLTRLLLFAVITFALGTGTFAGWRYWRKTHPPVPPGLLALRRAYSAERPLAGRISGFPYAPFQQTRGRHPGSDTGTLKQASELLLIAEAENPTPITQHALGCLYLTRRDFTLAEEKLKLALQTDPNNAALQNDYGLLLQERIAALPNGPETGEQVEQLAIALEYFNRALELDPRQPEASFNRARLYEQMLLPGAAREEWQKLLTAGASSTWHGETRQALQRLSEWPQPLSPQTPAQLLERLEQARQQSDEAQVWDLINLYRDRIGSVIVAELSNDYLLALHHNDATTAQRLLATLTYISSIEMRFAGDHFTADATAFYQQLAPKKRSQLLAARSLLQQGMKQLGEKKPEEIARLFVQAQQDFLALGALREAAQTALLLALCYRKPEELGTRTAIYQHALPICEKHRYRWLHVQFLFAQGYVNSSLANHSETIKTGKKGLELARAISDSNSAVKFLIQIAETYHQLGNQQQALALYFEGLRVVNQQPAEWWGYWAHSMSIGLPLNLLAHSPAAAAYQYQSLELARHSKQATQVCVSYLNIGLTDGFQQKHESAIKNLQLAIDTAQQVSSYGARQDLLALAALRLGELYYKAGAPQQAVASFDQAIKLYREVSSQQALSYAAHKGKLLACLAQEDDALLEQEINSVLALFERYRVKIREESNRNLFFDREQNIYDIAVDFWYARKNDQQKAFELNESGRARTLLDLVNSQPLLLEEAGSPEVEAKAEGALPPPLRLAEIQARMPAQSQIVQYAVLPNRLLIWFVTGQQTLLVREQPISQADLGKLVADFSVYLSTRPQSGQTPASNAGQQLYRLLIEPVAPLLQSGKVLCLVPDKMLNQVAFAALPQAGTKRFLIEDYQIVFAPSATLFVLCSEWAKAKEKSSYESALIIGDPKFDRDAFPTLDNISDAGKEAHRIAEFYQLTQNRSQVLTGELASKQRMLTAIEHCNVLHFAMHCVVDEHAPMRSKLILAQASSQAEGVLQAYEIYRLPLERLRLVVLAACRSGVERYYEGEGMIGISRPFLAKRVPLVIASLWDVDSEATAELMADFHRLRKLQRMPSAEALRQTQLKMLRDPKSGYQHPYYWASFEALGGQTTF